VTARCPAQRGGWWQSWGGQLWGKKLAIWGKGMLGSRAKPREGGEGWMAAEEWGHLTPPPCPAWKAKGKRCHPDPPWERKGN